MAYMVPPASAPARTGNSTRAVARENREYQALRVVLAPVVENNGSYSYYMLQNVMTEAAGWVRSRINTTDEDADFWLHTVWADTGLGEVFALQFDHLRAEVGSFKYPNRKTARYYNELVGSMCAIVGDYTVPESMHLPYLKAWQRVWRARIKILTTTLPPNSNPSPPPGAPLKPIPRYGASSAPPVAAATTTTRQDSPPRKKEDGMRRRSWEDAYDQPGDGAGARTVQRPRREPKDVATNPFSMDTAHYAVGAEPLPSSARSSQLSDAEICRILPSKTAPNARTAPTAPEPLAPIVTGSQVVATNLKQRPEMNGDTGTVVGWAEHGQRWLVKMHKQNEKVLAFLPSTIRAVEVAKPAPPPETEDMAMAVASSPPTNNEAEASFSGAAMESWREIATEGQRLTPVDDDDETQSQPLPLPL